VSAEAIVAGMPNPWADRRPLLIAHRGGAREAPENTLHAFGHGAASGAHMLELDVHASADGEIVVIHDAAVDRTTDGSGPVAAHSLRELRALDAAHWFVRGEGAVTDAPHYPLRGVATGAAEPPPDVDPADLRVPTLAEVLEAFPTSLFTMELKAAGIHEPVVALLTALGRERDVIVGGFDTERVGAFRATAPQIATSATEAEVARFWAWAHGHGEDPGALPYVALQVPPVYRGLEVVTEAFVNAAHARGLPVHVWTVDDDEAMHRLLGRGVDGIMTDRPTALAKVLAERGEG
jgi:glycerophosphoryl diester phosphodiesterase